MPAVSSAGAHARRGPPARVPAGLAPSQARTDAVASPHQVEGPMDTDLQSVIHQASRLRCWIVPSLQSCRKPFAHCMQVHHGCPCNSYHVAKCVLTAGFQCTAQHAFTFLMACSRCVRALYCTAVAAAVFVQATCIHEPHLQLRRRPSLRVCGLPECRSHDNTAAKGQRLAW